jgi:hypothetical protein
MKVQGAMIQNKGGRNPDASDAHKAKLLTQNGKKSRGIRAANAKSDVKSRKSPNSGCISKKKRRMDAIHTVSI